MIDQLERDLRDLFADDAAAAPEVIDATRLRTAVQRELRSRRIRSGVVGVVLVAAATAAVTVAPHLARVGGPARDPAAGPISRIVGPGPCPPNALCDVGFSIDGVHYTLSCSPVPPGLVSSDVLATGAIYEAVEVRRIDGEPTDVSVAARSPYCDDMSPTTTGGWFVAYPQTLSPQQTARRDAACADAFAKERSIHGCP